MNSIDLNQSFNKFKKQFMEQERQLIQKGDMFPLFDEAHNMGVDRCINFVKSQEQMYRAIDPNGLSAITCEAIWKTLEHFIKPIPSPKKETV